MTQTMAERPEKAEAVKVHAEQEVVEKVGLPTAIKRNPAGMLFICYFGIHSAMMAVPYYLVIYDLGAQVWGKSMTHHLVIFDAVRLLLGVVCAGLFGTLGDRCGNHLTVSIELAFGVAPIILLMIMGLTPAGLHIFCGVRALSGLTGASTVTSAPCLYAYAHELIIRPSDYRVLTGFLFAVSTLTTMAGLMIGRKVDVAAGPKGVLWFGIGLFALQILVLLILKTPLFKRLAQKEDRGTGNPDMGSSESESSSGESTASTATEAQPERRSVSPIGWLRLACENKSMLRVCLIAMLVCMAEMVLSDVKAQYAFSCFDILEGKENGKMRRKIAFLVTVSIWCSVGVGCFIMSLLSRCFSAFTLLKWSILAIAVFQVVPVFLTLHPTVPVLIMSSGFIGLAYAVLPPLQAAIPEVAPEGRVSEAIGAMGSFKCAAYFLTTVILLVALPPLEKAEMENPLWPLFPICGAFALAAFPLAWSLRPLPKKAVEANAA